MRATCKTQGCGRPVHVARTGRVSDSCKPCSDAYRERLTEEARERKEARIAALASGPVIEGMCWRCMEWEMQTGRIRECRLCTVGLKVLAENELWRGQEEAKQERARATGRRTGGRAAHRPQWNHEALFARARDAR